MFSGFHCAIKQCALHEGGDLAIYDSEILRQASLAQNESAFGAKAVVSRRIDPAIADRRVAATINVYAVAVGVQRHIVHGQVVATGDENRKMPAVKNSHVAD